MMEGKNTAFITKLDFITSWFLLGFLLAFFKGGDCLRINDIVVPNVIENGSEPAVVLDCDYSLEDTDKGLVVKWFLDNSLEPVYQWIPPKKPQDLGKLKGKLNLQYRASDEGNKMYRALQILNPSPELSGEYKCLVSTYDNEASLSKKMVVFVPLNNNLNFWHTVDEDDRHDNNVDQEAEKQIAKLVNVSCEAQGVYPEPVIRIFSASKPVTDKAHTRTKIRNGLYDVIASVQIDDDDMDAQEHVFECELSIPEANYTVRKALYVSLENGSGSRRFMSVWLLLNLIFNIMISSLL